MYIVILKIHVLLQTGKDQEYQKKIEQNQKAAEERTAKKRAKRWVDVRLQDGRQPQSESH